MFKFRTFFESKHGHFTAKTRSRLSVCVRALELLARYLCVMFFFVFHFFEHRRMGQFDVNSQTVRMSSVHTFWSCFLFFNLLTHHHLVCHCHHNFFSHFSCPSFSVQDLFAMHLLPLKCANWPAISKFACLYVWTNCSLHFCCATVNRQDLARWCFLCNVGHLRFFLLCVFCFFDPNPDCLLFVMIVHSDDGHSALLIRSTAANDAQFSVQS